MNNIEDTDIGKLDGVALTQLYRDKQLSPVEATQVALQRIEQYNEAVNAYCYVDPQGALAAARASEKRWLNGTPLSPIDGIPSSIKDLTMVAGLPCRNGSLTSSKEPSTENAPYTARMIESGAVILGKTTTPEFGWKGVTDSPLTGITRNPWDTRMTSGGSSGGAAVAAALNMGILHQGSDAGGSVRIPGGFCGVFGLKPTYGYIPQWPASAMTTLSHIGPLTRTVRDSIALLDVVAQPDIKDWYSHRSFNKTLSNELALLPKRPLRIAYSPTLGYVSVEPQVQATLDIAVKALEGGGHKVELVDPGFSDPIGFFSTLWFSGAAKVVQAMTAEQKSQLDPGFLRIGELGENISAAEYIRAMDARAKFGVQMNQFHQQYDLLVTPTLPITAFPVGQDTVTDHQQHWMEWTPFSYPFNLTQQPAATVPVGFADGLPVGMQLIAGCTQDALVLQVAEQLMQVMPPKYPEAPYTHSS